MKASAELTADPTRRLAIYLNDHLAGAMLGVEMARRLRDSNAEEPQFGPPLAELCAEIEADRETLQRLMESRGIGRDKIKPAGAWAAEKLGRLKLNGQIRGYSPLSRLLELEFLYIGVTGKMRLWTALEGALGSAAGEIDFAQLGERAGHQLATLDELHLKAAALALRG